MQTFSPSRNLCCPGNGYQPCDNSRYSIPPGRLFCEPEKIRLAVEFHQICDDPGELNNKNGFIHPLYKVALQKQRQVTQTPSSRSFVVRFTHGSVFITASNLNDYWCITVQAESFEVWNSLRKKWNKEPGLWNPDVGTDGDSRKVDVRYRRVGRLNLLGAFFKSYSIFSD